MHTQNATLAARPSSLVYVVNSGTPLGNSVSVINTRSSNTVIATIPVGNGPFDLKLTPDNARAYIANRGSNNVSVINTSSNTVITSISLGSGDNYPVGMAINSAGTRVFTVNNGADGDSLNIIDTGSNTVINTIPMGSFPNAVAAKPNSNLVYVMMSGNTVKVIDTTTNAIVDTFSISEDASGMIFNANGTRLYLTSVGGIILVVDPSINSEIDKVLVSSISGNPILSADGLNLYTTGPICNISVMDTTTNKWVAALPLAAQGGCGGLVLNAANNCFYVSNSGAFTVSEINVSNGETFAIIPVGNGPLGIAIKP